MNMSTYGLLAATLLAAYNVRGKGSRNPQTPDSIADFLRSNQSARPDALLATLYSFMDLEEVDFDLSLGSLTNQENSVPIPLQPIFIYKIMTDFSNPQIINQLVDTLIAGSTDPNFLKMWNTNAKPLLSGYTKFFRNNDAGVAFNFVAMGVYPQTLNREQWSQYFKGSTDNAGGFVEPAPDKEIAIQQLFVANLYSNTEKVVSQGSSGISLQGPLSIDTLFFQADYVFKLLKEYLGQLEVRLWNPIEIGLELNRLVQMSGGSPIETNAFYIDFVLKALNATNTQLQGLGNPPPDNYASLYNYLNSPSRMPSDLMVSIQMNSYRSNPLTAVVDRIYRGKTWDGGLTDEGLLAKKWKETNTPSWAIVSWLLYYIYSMFKKHQLPSMLKYSQGLQVSMRLNKGMAFLQSKNKNITAYNQSVSTIIERVRDRSGNSQETEDIKNVILTGPTPPHLFNISSRPIDVEELGDLDFEDETYKIYRTSGRYGDEKDSAIAEMSRYMSHCKTAPEDDHIYSILIDDIPFYTISTQYTYPQSGGRKEEIKQFKGFKNRAMGYTTHLNTVEGKKKAVQRGKTQLAKDDAKHVLKFLSVTPQILLEATQPIIKEDFIAIWPLIKKGTSIETFSESVYNVLTSR